MRGPAYEQITSAFEQNVLRMHEAKAQGHKVVGQFCIYTPSEIAVAAGAIPVSLCGTRNDVIPAAETILPRSICPLIKSSFGFAVKDACPYFAASDLIVGDTTCDGKKKMYELLAAYKPIHLLQLPQRQDADALRWWREQFVGLVKRMEHAFGVSITEDKLRESIHLLNRERLALKRLLDLAKRRPSPLTGMEMVELAFKTSFFPNKEVGIAMLDAVTAERTAMADAGKTCVSPTAPRILITGTPIGMGSHKVVQLLQEAGASPVCLDNCSAYKKTRLIIDEDKDPLTAMAERYLNVPCAVMSPNPFRYETLRELAEAFSADAVVDLTWQGCQPYAIEAWSVKKFVRSVLKLPYLNIETDYSETDTEQLRVRIEAFVEMLA